METLDRIDMYWNEKKPGVELCVPHGSGLPDLLIDVDNWNLDHTACASEFPEGFLRTIATDGHAFREIGNE